MNEDLENCENCDLSVLLEDMRLTDDSVWLCAECWRALTQEGENP